MDLARSILHPSSAGPMLADAFEDRHVNWDTVAKVFPMLSGGEQAVVKIAKVIALRWPIIDTFHRSLIIGALLEYGPTDGTRWKLVKDDED